MADFDYGKAEADLDSMGCHNPEEIYDFKSEKGFESYMREQGLNPNNYRNNNPSNNSGGFNGSSGTEGCYITSACVTARGLADDCDELLTLRSFRDTYLKKLESGKTEVEEYYLKAPKVVEAINKRADAKKVWESIYSHMILPCVKLIKEQKYAETYELYKSYSKKLAQDYVEEAQ